MMPGCRLVNLPKAHEPILNKIPNELLLPTCAHNISEVANAPIVRVFKPVAFGLRELLLYRWAQCPHLVANAQIKGATPHFKSRYHVRITD
jgi:hypothetical protein